MKVLVFSDSHGRTLDMYDAIEREQPDAVLHLGDCYEDARDLQRSYPDLTVCGVAGNNDWGADAPSQAVVALEGVRIYLTHGHREGVSYSSPGRVPVHAQEQGCQLALFGHTHIVYQGQHGPVTALNPGSISLPRRGVASYAVLRLESGRVDGIALRDTEGAPWDPEKRRKQKRLGWF